MGLVRAGNGLLRRSSCRDRVGSGMWWRWTLVRPSEKARESDIGSRTNGGLLLFLSPPGWPHRAPSLARRKRNLLPFPARPELISPNRATRHPDGVIFGDGRETSTASGDQSDDDRGSCRPHDKSRELGSHQNFVRLSLISSDAASTRFVLFAVVSPSDGCREGGGGCVSPQPGCKGGTDVPSIHCFLGLFIVSFG